MISLMWPLSQANLGNFCHNWLAWDMISILFLAGKTDICRVTLLYWQLCRGLSTLSKSPGRRLSAFSANGTFFKQTGGELYFAPVDNVNLSPFLFIIGGCAKRNVAWMQSTDNIGMDCSRALSTLRRRANSITVKRNLRKTRSPPSILSIRGTWQKRMATEWKRGQHMSEMKRDQTQTTIARQVWERQKNDSWEEWELSTCQSFLKLSVMIPLTTETSWSVLEIIGTRFWSRATQNTWAKFRRSKRTKSFTWEKDDSWLILRVKTMRIGTSWTCWVAIALVQLEKHANHASTKQPPPNFLEKHISV